MSPEYYRSATHDPVRWEGVWDPELHLFYLWAESETLYPLPPGPEAVPTEVRIHPFAVPNDVLRARLSEAEIDFFDTRNIELLLPSIHDRPLCSPKLHVSGDGRDPAQLIFQAWTVPAVALRPLEALNFLSSPVESGEKRLRLDDSVLFFREATKLCLDLLTRGRFVPGLIREDRGYHSCWSPVMTDTADLSRMHLLAAGMPGLCRALVDRSVEPRTILEEFLSTACEELIRLFLRRSPLVAEGLKPRYFAAGEWVRSLNREDRALGVPENELTALDERLRAWSGKLLPVGKTQKLQTVFRVLPPPAEVDAEDAKWTIEFLLRSAAKHDSVLPAEQLWSGNLGFLQNSEHLRDEIEDQFLTDLGRAVKVFPELKRALNDTYPARLLVSTEEVYDFLQSKCSTLEEMGFALLLPGWWNKPSSKLGLKLTLDSGAADSVSYARAPFLASHQLLEFSWNIAFGDRELSRQEFQDMVSRHAPLVRVDGQWVELDPERVSSTLRFLEEQEQRGKLSFVEALHLGLGLEERTHTFPIVGLNARGWIQKLLDTETHDLEPCVEPEGFLGELRPYQREGLSWLSFRTQLGIGACLADDMGLGKTIQFLALVLHDQLRAKRAGSDATRRPILLVVPMSILANWEHEIRRFAPSLTVYLHHGAQRLTKDAFLERAQNSSLVITTYSLAFRDEDSISAVHWAGIVLDEAQNIKNTETKQTKAIRRLCHNQLKRASGGVPFHRMALTGTPLENHLEELWSIFDFLNPGFLGSLQEFRTRFAIPIERFRNKNAADALSRLLRPFVLRRLKSDPKIIDDLPEKIEMTEVVPLTREQAALYQSALDDMLPQVEAAQGMHRKGLVLATITKLKQICNHPALFLKDGSEISGRSQKIARLEQLLEEIVAEGDKALLFTQFSQLGHLLQPYLQQRFDTDVLFLHGALPKQAREKLVNRFQTPSGPPIFILSLKAGGFGLNLTEANQVIHLDQWWNPAVEDQATDRAYRIGQKRNVQVRKLICQGTLEERIAEMLKHKKELADQIVGSTKDSITQLSTDELRRLLELSSGQGLSDTMLSDAEEDT